MPSPTTVFLHLQGHENLIPAQGQQRQGRSSFARSHDLGNLRLKRGRFREISIGDGKPCERNRMILDEEKGNLEL